MTKKALAGLVDLRESIGRENLGRASLDAARFRSRISPSRRAVHRTPLRQSANPMRSVFCANQVICTELERIIGVHRPMCSGRHMTTNGHSQSVVGFSSFRQDCYCVDGIGEADSRKARRAPGALGLSLC
jgi:hypothetical protein